MDALVEVLREVRIRTVVHGRLELALPWGLRVEAREKPSFHVVAHGRADVAAEGVRHALEPGDFVFVRAGVDYVLEDGAGTRPVHAATLVAQCGTVVRHGGEGARTSLLCGAFELEGAALHPVLASMPPVLVVKAREGGASRWVASTAELVRLELDSASAGYEALVVRCAEVLLVQALRTHLASSDHGGLARALFDPQLGSVLREVHARPAAPWTVGGLARLAGMSRSVFAARFKAIIGHAPQSYVTRVRMHRAMQLLYAGTPSTGEVAEAVGYATDGAFVKAFKRHVGTTPGAFRARARNRVA